MNIYQVRENLVNTITGKELLLARTNHSLYNQVGERMALIATKEFLQINIDELKRILQDVEQCLPDEFANMRNGV